MRTLWTEDLDAVLVEGYTKGLSFSQIGDKLGVSRNVIAGRCHRLGLARPAMEKNPSRRSKSSKPEKLTKQTKHVEEVETVIPVVIEIAEPRGSVEAILALRSRSCRFSFGDPRRADFHFCMKTTQVGRSLCSEHYQLSYVKDKRR